MQQTLGADDVFGPSSACVYMFWCDNQVKIGISKDIAKRARDVQVGAPHPVVPIWAMRMSREHARRIERLTHHALGKGGINNTSGEWFFTYEPDKIARFIKRVVDKMGIPHLIELSDLNRRSKNLDKSWEIHYRQIQTRGLVS